MKEVSSGFLKKDAKAYRPDKETGKWRGGKTKNGSFDTIKPGWSSEINIDGSTFRLDVWGFNARWGVQSLFFKLFREEKTNERF